MVGTESFPSEVDTLWGLIERSPYVIGDFVWTAMDYLGEAALGRTGLASDSLGPDPYPWFAAYCGDIDLIGQQKPQSLVRDVIWGLSPLAMLVQRPIPEGQKEFIAPWGWRDELPSWTWPDAVGKPLAVRLYTAGDRVDLLLNGTSLGTKALTPKDKGIAEFAVPYAPGIVEGVAYRGGKQIGRQRLETVGAPARLRLTPEPAATRHGLSYIGIELLDAKGRVIPEGEVAVELAVSGPARLIGFGSANPFAVGSFQSSGAKTFRGRALAILRATGSAGTVRIEARAAGLQGGTAMIRMA
jgi:beta-galactosidase